MATKPLLIALMTAAQAWGMAGHSGMGPDAPFLGIFREGVAERPELASDFSRQYGIKPSVALFFQDFTCPFPTVAVTKLKRIGAVPVIGWEPWRWDKKKTITLFDINAGKYDGYIRDFAIRCGKWGHPVFIRWAHEMNVEQGYPWSVGKNGKDGQIYVSAYRRIVRIFRKQKAFNAIWVWAPNRESVPAEEWNSMENAYPGDAYVDVIGIDGFNWGVKYWWSGWLSFEQIFAKPVRELSKNHPGKPIIIAEMGCAETGGDKGEWLKEMAAALKKMPIRGIVYFDQSKECPWALDSNDKSSEAFRNIARTGLFTDDIRPFLRTLRSAAFEGGEVEQDSDTKEVPNE